MRTRRKLVDMGSIIRHFVIDTGMEVVVFVVQDPDYPLLIWERSGWTSDEAPTMVTYLAVSHIQSQREIKSDPIYSYNRHSLMVHWCMSFQEMQKNKNKLLNDNNLVFLFSVFTFYWCHLRKDTTCKTTVFHALVHFEIFCFASITYLLSH